MDKGHRLADKDKSRRKLALQSLIYVLILSDTIKMTTNIKHHSVQGVSQYSEASPASWKYHLTLYLMIYAYFKVQYQ